MNVWPVTPQSAYSAWVERRRLVSIDSDDVPAITRATIEGGHDGAWVFVLDAGDKLQPVIMPYHSTKEPTQ